MKRVFIIHGWSGTPESHWYPWITNELEKRGFKVIKPKMPNTNFPKLDEWLSKLNNEIKNPDKDTYIIGHSLGTITTLRFLESLEQGEIGGCVLVAGFSKDLGIKEIETFTSKSVDWQRVKRRCKQFIAIMSDNDRYKELRNWSEIKLQGAEIIIDRNKNHFCKADGVTELPSALKSILKLAGENND